MSDLCEACVMGDHPSCEIWTCACLHGACPAPADQLTIDDALDLLGDTLTLRRRDLLPQEDR